MSANISWVRPRFKVRVEPFFFLFFFPLFFHHFFFLYVLSRSSLLFSIFHAPFYFFLHLFLYIQFQIFAGRTVRQNVIPITTTFSANTSANMTQDLLDSKMEKRRKGVFGPASGKKYYVHVDGEFLSDSVYNQ